MLLRQLHLLDADFLKLSEATSFRQCFVCLSNTLLRPVRKLNGLYPIHLSTLDHLAVGVMLHAVFFTEFVSFVLNLVIILFIVKSWNLNMCFSCQ